ncbi:hypothetical protein GDO86_013772 [Hymenochirus boettgeri]|uniref:Myocardin n=1 Tax=Hymenochirus boettgeri TaxID=247094 RepID=A0A8T2JRK1_9PIPI|nr:hypothetical protein GDO86_013772 [Hymenochirus boettgeri]
MTLLGSEHSLLIRSKFRSALKNPAAFQEQRKHVDRAKTEEYLKHKIRSRPELLNMHMLQDQETERSTHAAQIKLKRARLADDLNERIALRPGPLELVEKNIIPVESTVKEAIKGSQVNFAKPVDAFAFEEDSSNDDLSPDQDRSEASQVIAKESLQETKSLEPLNSIHSGPTQNHSQEQENDADDGSCIQNHPCSIHSDSQMPSTGCANAAVKSKASTDTKNRHKKPKDIKPKVKKLKYHQYIPPDQKAEKSPPPMDSAYARLLQQQQLFLQLQILSQQQQHQHISYQGMQHPQLKLSNDHMTRNGSPTAIHSPSLSPVKTSFSGQANSMKPGALPSNLDDLKVSELRQHLRIRGLPVSGTKTSLMERLRPFQECGGNAVPTFGDITTVTFPVTPNGNLSSYQSHAPASVLSNGFYQFGSTSSTPPISPASSDLSVSGSLPDTFSDGPMSSPQFGLHPSPIHLSAEESLMGSINSGSYHAELEGVDAEKDKMLVEKQKVINELTWKLQQEQRQVEELRLQLQKRKGDPQDKHLPSQHFFGVAIKQENVSSCPFASKQMSLLNNNCIETAAQNSILSSTFLSPQCSPQHSPLGTTGSPQHISLPPSPNNRYLLSVSPSSHGEGRSISPNVANRLHPTQQITRSQQMDELLDVLIESGEIPANAKEERPCGQKHHQLNGQNGNSNTSMSNVHLPYDSCPSNGDGHLEVLLNSHSPLGRNGELRLLKIGNENPQFDNVMNGFPRKSSEEILPSREVLDTSLSPMETQMSPSSAESAALQHLSFTESPWETIEWLDLTPPSSATGLGSLASTGPSIFNTDFLDVTDLNLNTAMELHLEHW